VRADHGHDRPGGCWSGPSCAWLAALDLPAVCRTVIEDDLAFLTRRPGARNRATHVASSGGAAREVSVMVWRPRRGRHPALRRTLNPWRRKVLRGMAADAIDFQLAELERPCPDCDRANGLICDRHAGVLARVEAYR